MCLPLSFDTIGDMPGTYTVHTDPSIPPVWHTQQKVPIKLPWPDWEDPEQDGDPQSHPPGQLTYWLGIFPHLPQEAIWHPPYICLDPQDLNKAVVWEHYKAPTLNEISQCLSGATTFSKLDTNDGFWSVHLNEKSSYLTTFNTHKGRY